MPDCTIFLRRGVADWIPAPSNLCQIREAGLEIWLKEQKKRQALVEEMLQSYNEGRSMTLFCKACSRMPIDMIGKAMQGAEAILTDGIVDDSDMKARARCLKSVIGELALEGGIGLN